MYATRNLSVLCYANGFTVWGYQANDLWQEITEPDYFDSAADLMNRGDRIMVTAADAAGDIIVTSADRTTARVRTATIHNVLFQRPAVETAAE